MKRKVSDYPALNVLNRFTHRTFCLTENKGQQRAPTATNDAKLQLQQSIISYSLWSWYSQNQAIFSARTQKKLL